MKLIAGQDKSFLPKIPKHAIDSNSENVGFEQEHLAL